MPPPASPASAVSRSASLNKSGLEELSLNNLEVQGQALQDRIALLMTDGANGSYDQFDPASPSQLNSADDRILELQARIDALETENEQILLQMDKAGADKQSSLIQELEQDRERVAETNAKLTKDRDELQKVHETTLASFRDLESLQRASQQRVDELENQLNHQLEKSKRTVDDLNAELSSIASMRQQLEQENQVLQGEKADLTAHVEELSTQADELRVAGQVRVSLIHNYSTECWSGNNSTL